MKFSSTLQFNAVPEWRDHYLDYDHLKKLIFRLERANVLTSSDDAESLVGLEPTEVFKKALDKEVTKIGNFYTELETKVFNEYKILEENIDSYMRSSEYQDISDRSSNALHNNTHASQRRQYVDNEDNAASDSSDDEVSHPSRRRSTVHDEFAMKKSIPFANVNLRREVTRLYVQLNEMLSFSDLNKEGIRKALKKFDKVHTTSMLPNYMEQIGQNRVFSDSASYEIGALIDKLVSKFANLVGEPEQRCEQTLSDLLREHVVYERNTVWRELIGMERQAQGVQPGMPSQLGQGGKHRRRGLAKLLNPQCVKLIGLLLIFVLMLLVQPLESLVQSRCLAVVVLASLLWATETLPLFVTGLAVPALVVVLRIPLDQNGEQMSAKAASAFVFARMWSPVIAVLLGGFTLAAALSKYNMAKALAQSIMTRSGTESPRKIILVLMFVSAFLCMWISNVAAPVLLFSVAQPLLRIVPPGDPFGKALILGIALASNVGGMASPIASPQNILALQNMDPAPSWIEWFYISIPVCFISIVVIWMFLCLTFPVTNDARNAMAHIRGPNHSADFGKMHAYILFVTILTIGLWCFSHQLEFLVGDMGILALLPMVLLFGPGILSAADFNNFLWTIVALAMGGIVLGKSVESCGLLVSVASSIKEKVADLPLIIICITFGLMILFVASFISHTVAALIILPLVKSVGEQLEDPHPRLLVMISAMLCSAAMALPTSGFPNVTAVCIVDELGMPYLTARDFISRGIPASLLVYVVVVTLGYLVCSLVGF